MFLSPYLYGGPGQLAVHGEQRKRHAISWDALRPRAVREVVWTGVAGAAQRVVGLDAEVIVAHAVVSRLTGPLAVVGGLWRGKRWMLVK